MKNIEIILFPSSFLDKRKIDEDLEKEYNAAKETGLFDIVLFDYERWYNNKELVITTNTPETMKDAVYRGWMMKPEEYEKFYDGLLENKIRLVTNKDEYNLMHIFPNVYEYIKEDTAKIQTYRLHEKISVDDLNKIFKKFMVKDFVKSVKGTEFPKYFNNTTTQEEFEEAMQIFYKYRGNLLTGGICIKEFLPLRYYDGKTNEYRVFYINNMVESINQNSNNNNTPAPPTELIEKYKSLNSLFYTIDFAELDDGTWKILETGDGSVSGTTDKQDYEHFFTSLSKYFKIQKR